MFKMFTGKKSQFCQHTPHTTFPEFRVVEPELWGQDHQKVGFAFCTTLFKKNWIQSDGKHSIYHFASECLPHTYIGPISSTSELHHKVNFCELFTESELQDKILLCLSRSAYFPPTIHISSTIYFQLQFTCVHDSSHNNKGLLQHNLYQPVILYFESLDTKYDIQECVSFKKGLDTINIAIIAIIFTIVLHNSCQTKQTYLLMQYTCILELCDLLI